jgi:hypothetical protein
MEALLDLPTGRLIVGDPGTLFGDAAPLAPALPPGGHPVRADAAGFELLLAAGEPVRWETAGPGFATPSGYVCLLDAAALDEFTGLGDEPVDEYELLAERLADAPGRPVAFSGLLALPAAAQVRALRAGYDTDGRLVRITARY